MVQRAPMGALQYFKRPRGPEDATSLLKGLGIVRRLVLMTPNARLQRCEAVKANVSPIINLTNSDFKFQAARFLPWRRTLR